MIISSKVLAICGRERAATRPGRLDVTDLFPATNMAGKDYYKTLGVSKDASEDDIKKAYKKAVSPGARRRPAWKAHEVLTSLALTGAQEPP